MEWKTISAKISEEDYGAMKIICDREKKKVNEFVASLIKKETEKVKGTSQNVFPTIGENNFTYDPESDSFIWAIHTGTSNPLIVSSKLGPHFVESVYLAMKQGIDKRNKFLKQIKKKQSYIPEAIRRFKE
ncbi:hypothetical protein J4461_01970 [Candidatus Pacearchaeota archaeon]|nr:hypothetical protein [Candidatus Pacearchaeota archaeon]